MLITKFVDAKRNNVYKCGKSTYVSTNNKNEKEGTKFIQFDNLDVTQGNIGYKTVMYISNFKSFNDNFVMVDKNNQTKIMSKEDGRQLWTVLIRLGFNKNINGNTAILEKDKDKFTFTW